MTSPYVILLVVEACAVAAAALVWMEGSIWPTAAWVDGPCGWPCASFPQNDVCGHTA